MPAECRYTGREDDLALYQRNLAAFFRLSPSALQGLLIAGIKKLDKGRHGEEGSGDIEV